MTNLQPHSEHYSSLLLRISDTYAAGQRKALAAINTALLETYWQIGRHIVEFEQGGQIKAEYGMALLERLATDLTLQHGKGFSRSNLNYMRLLYGRFPICETLSHKFLPRLVFSPSAIQRKSQAHLLTQPCAW